MLLSIKKEPSLPQYCVYIYSESVLVLGYCGLVKSWSMRDNPCLCGTVPDYVCPGVSDHECPGVWGIVCPGVWGPVSQVVLSALKYTVLHVLECMVLCALNM